MDNKLENSSNSFFAVNATASLDFQNGSIEEQIRPLTEEEVKAQAEARKRSALGKSNREFSLSVTQASTEAMRILENQGFGRSINAAAQSLISSGLMGPTPPKDAKTSDTKSPTAPATPAVPAAEDVKSSKLSGATNIAPVFTPKAPGTAPSEMPMVMDYMDYRRLLQDYYLFRREQSKKQIRPYSYANFAAAANIKSPNYLKMIIEGKRNLSPEMIGRFAKAMGLNKADTDQFRMLVMFNQSTDTSERNLLLKDLSDSRVERQLKAGEIDRKAWDKLPSWVAWVVYALLDQGGVDFKIESLREVLRGKAKADEIEAALKSLVDSGEIVYDESTQTYAKSKNRTENPEEIPVALIRKLQAQLMLLGLESLYQDSPTEREFGTLTLALTQSEFEELRFKLRQMRKQVHKDISINRMATPGERVYQLNLQLFPVSNKA